MMSRHMAITRDHYTDCGMPALPDLFSKDVSLAIQDSTIVADSINKTLIEKKDSGESDYSEGLARIFIAKSLFDYKLIQETIFQDITEEVLSVGKSQIVTFEEIVSAMKKIRAKNEEAIETIYYDLAAEMSPVEMGGLKDICGE